ncbi:MAG: A/G-specific adenine glycosylase [Rubricoccaceae bacterium]
MPAPPAVSLTERVTPAHARAFRDALGAWFEAHRRPMPWRETDAAGRRDPYRVWLSEVMLQQTRVDQAMPYYERFVAAFPTVGALADAPPDEVLKRWEGLGYYSRARNLQRAAQVVMAEHDGVFPSDPEAVRALPGVGDYTAAAILSLAFGQPFAVLDGNVVRVLARVFAVEADTRQGATRRALQHLADALLDREAPGRFNESLMELGATVCTPSAPACPVCPLAPVCAAHASGSPTAFPVVSRRARAPHHVVAVGLVSDEAGRLLVQRRPEAAMLGGLWEFPGGKQEPGETLPEAVRRELREELSIAVAVGPEAGRVRHAYSHFSITLIAFTCRLEHGEPIHHAGEPVRWASPEELGALAMPRASRKLLEVLRAPGAQASLF